MQAVIEEIQRRAEALARRPLFAWLRRDSVPLEERFLFAPVYVNFIMAFSDLNRWFFRYAAPEGEQERAINRHTFEDETHSRLFLEDWMKFELDGRLGWGAGETIRWYYAAPETEAFRAHGVELMALFTRHEDPCVRYAAMTAIEACGHVFFSATAEIAALLEARTGREYRYFGVYHLKKETGHLHAGGAAFEGVALDEPRRRTALTVATRIIEMFEEQFDRVFDYASKGRPDQPPKPPAPLLDLPLPPENRGEGGRGVRGLASEVRRALEERMRAAAGHDLFRWMDEDSGLSAEKKLQRFVALWTPDAMGYKDLNTYALAYRAPVDARERAINRWVAKLATHHPLFLRDWAALGMDRLLGWKASDTLRFYCLSKHTELQRQNMATFVKLACKDADPVQRYWLMTALEASGEAFFHHTRKLAERVERETGQALDYLANRHAISHPTLPPDDEADGVDFEREALSPAGQDRAIFVIHTVFDAILAQCSLSLDVARKNALHIG